MQKNAEKSMRAIWRRAGSWVVFRNKFDGDTAILNLVEGTSIAGVTSECPADVHQTPWYNRFKETT